jgi:hypothetical protein
MLNSLIGIIASSGGEAAAGNSYESIATVTVGSGGTSSITFSSIPSTYQHLQVRAIGRSNRSATGEFIKFTMNSDTGSNYADHSLNAGGGGNAFGDAATSAAFIRVNRFAGSTANANVFGVFVLDLLDYANTSKYKTIRELGGCDNNGDGDIFYNSGLWQSTSAVNSLTFTVGGGTLFSQYTQFALYGIKG